MYKCLKAEFRFAAVDNFTDGRVEIIPDRTVKSILKSDDILAVYDVETEEVLEANKALTRVFGKTLDEIIGTKLGDYVPEDLLISSRAYNKKAVEENTIHVVGDEREGRSFYHIIIPLNKQNPNIVRIISIDITETKNLLQRSKQRDAQLELIIKNLPVTLYSLRVSGGIESVEVHSNNFLGYGKDTMYKNSENWFKLIHPDDLDIIKNGYKKAVKGIKSDNEYRIMAKDGQWHWFLDKGKLIRDDADEMYLYGALVDITSQKENETELKNTLYEKDLLMKEINHRVKNNLMMISSIISLKEAETGDDLSDITHQIDAIRIVHEKLHQSENATEINFSDYCSDLISTIASSFADYPIKFINNIGNITIPTEKAIPLAMITNELVTNAMKHGFSADSPSEIAISIQLTGGSKCRMTVSNNGRPIPYTVDINSAKTLGLRLIQALVSQLNGSLDIIKGPHPVFTIDFKIN